MMWLAGFLFGFIFGCVLGVWLAWTWPLRRP